MFPLGVQVKDVLFAVQNQGWQAVDGGVQKVIVLFVQKLDLHGVLKRLRTCLEDPISRFDMGQKSLIEISQDLKETAFLRVH